MISMTKEEVLQHVQGVIDAPSAYAGLKDVAKEYLAAVGKADEKEKAQKLIAALEECVCSIDDVLPFFASDKAKELFGADQAAAMLKKGQEVKAAGGDTCFCPACTNGKFVLDHKNLLLNA
ncbi:heat-shock protein Hsp90 [Mitsuokella sp. AF21-1AC]|nr:heat-shock protein Hsp90 [Mitsuokella sp. AF21-1AC]